MRREEARPLVRRVGVFVVVAIAAALLAIPSAEALEASDTLVTTTIDGDILWVEAHIDDSEADVVKINVRTPSRDGRRQLWQRCRMSYSGPGTYRCGIDVGPDSAARNRLGTWRTGVSVDGTHAGHAHFALST